MAEEMRCWVRTVRGNHVSAWRHGEGHHLQWIRNYFAQPNRNMLVLIGGTDEDGDMRFFRCQADSNDRIVGTLAGRRVEIVWARRERTEAEVLARYP